MEGDNIFRYRNMDIKLGGREMATVVYSNEEDDMCSLVIDGEEYVEDEERAIIPKAVLKQIRVEDIPENFQIEVCESKDSSVIMVSVPMTFVKVGKNEFQVIYDELITRKYWDEPIGLKLYMETKRDVIEERSKEVRDIHLENYDDVVLMAPRKESIMYYDIVESGKRIKEMRKKAGMTQEELADAIGMTREALARIETGKNGTSVDGIINFAHYF